MGRIRSSESVVPAPISGAVPEPDPTQDEKLQTLKDKLLSDAAVRDFVAFVNRTSSALVLSGGGGKGAYEAGAILALFDCGLTQFRALAGTSVGALNAALFHQVCRTRERAWVLRTWHDISPFKVMRPTLASIVSLPLKAILFAALGLIGLLSNLSLHWLYEHQTDLDVLTGNAGFWVWARRTFPRGLWKVFLTLCAVFVFSMTLYWGAVLLYHPIGRPPSNDEMLLAGLIVLVGCGALIVLRNWLATHLSIVSNVPLRETIAQFDIEAMRTSPVPIDCTMTTTTKYWFPFRPDNAMAGPEIERRRIRAPIYVPLNKVDTADEALDWLLQTAALPEIFPTRKLKGLYFVDGGIVDNTPILAVLEYKPELIITIYLDHRLSRVPNLRAKESARVFTVAERVARGHLTERDDAAKIRHDWLHARLWRFSQMKDPGGWSSLIANPFPDRDLDHPTILPQIDFLDKVEWLPIIPSEAIDPCPKLLIGTLNFFSTTARTLMRLGYKDTLEWIRREAQRRVASASL
jgi:predicted acylesterase/phospholipase RssA